MNNELFERELQNTSINDVSLADYVKENYLPVSVIDKIRAEISEGLSIIKEHSKSTQDDIDRGTCIGLQMALNTVDKYRTESDHKCHTCKHYMSGEHDGSCGSYVCKGYSDWESEGKG